MLITLLGMMIEVKLLQSEKASSPMLVTLSGMVMEVKLLQHSKALYPMVVTLPSHGILLLLHPLIKVLVSVSIRQFSELW